MHVDPLDVCVGIKQLFEVEGDDDWVVYKYDEIPESVNENKTLLIYPEGGDEDERSGFGGVRDTNALVVIDCYVRPRSTLAEDVKALTEFIESFLQVLRNDKTMLSSTCDDFTWTWRRHLYDDGARPTPTLVVGLRCMVEASGYGK